MAFEIDVKEVVQTLSHELRDYSIRRRKYIEKPRPYRLPLKHRKCTLKHLQAKYPSPWLSYGLKGFTRVFSRPKIQMPPGLPFTALFKPYTDRI